MARFPSQAHRPLRRPQKKQKWESLKDDIKRIYLLENKTLQETIKEIEGKHTFKASERKWKMKLKEWRFDKYLSTTDMQFIVNKNEKRAREGKNTRFFHNGVPLLDQKIQNFKKRKTTIETCTETTSADTPEFITYKTPEPSVEHLTESHEIQKSPSVAEISDDSMTPSDETLLAGPSTPMIGSLVREIEKYPILVEHFRIQATGSEIGTQPVVSPRPVSDNTFIDIIAQTIENARRSIDEGQLSAAEPNFLSAIILCIQCEVHGLETANGILHATANRKTRRRDISDFLDFLDQYGTSFQHSVASPTYRQLLSFAQATFGSLDLLSVRLCSISADIMKRAAIPDEQKLVEGLLEDGINGFQQLEQYGEQFRCQLCLCELLLDNPHRQVEGLKRLCSSLGQYIRAHLCWRDCTPTQFQGSNSPGASTSNVPSVSAELSRLTNADILPTVTAIRMLITKQVQAREFLNENRFCIRLLQYAVRLGALLASTSSFESYRYIRQAVDSLFRAVVSKLGPLYKDTFWYVIAYVYLHRSIYAYHRLKWKKCFEDLVIAYKVIAGKDNTHEYDLHSTYASTRDTLRTRLLQESDTSYIAYSDVLSTLEERAGESGDLGEESASTYYFLLAAHFGRRKHSEKRKRIKRKREEQASMAREIDSSTNRMSSMSIGTNTGRSAKTAASGSESKGSGGTNQYGVTFTEGSEMSDISFDYSALHG